MDRKSQIDAEIERIRKKCAVKYYVDVDNVVVKSHERKNVDYDFEDGVDEEFNRHVKVDSDDEAH